MTQTSLKDRLVALPVPILPTMVGAATLANMWAPLGFSWIRHITMWVAALILLCYILKIICHFDFVKKEYGNTIPASLYAGFTMLTMILGNYIFDYSPVVGKALWAIGLALHTVHLVIFIYRYVLKGVNLDTFVPSWFVTFNGIMVSCVTGVPMNEPAICKIIVYYGIAALVIIMPFMVVRLMKRPVADALIHTKAIVLAPSSLCLVSYLNFIEAPHAFVVYALYAVVFISLLYVVIKLPVFFSFAFYPGFAGLTFPMAIGIVASSKMAAYLTAQGQTVLGGIVQQISGLQLYATTAIISYVLFNFFMIFLKSLKPKV